MAVWNQSVVVPHLDCLNCAEGEILDKWYSLEADMFMLYLREGHGKYMIILINVISSAYFVCYTSGYVHPARLLAYD